MRDTAAVTETHCPYCSLQCGMTLAPAGRGRLRGRQDSSIRK